ncbi:MAG TPA: tetratricopeptide repeat protein [Terriglobales bacterium]|nr:tetratricopeptide repeat protein [Terriglobales bacterium]
MRRVWIKVVGCLMLCLPPGLLLSQQPGAFESLLASAQQAQARSDFQSAAKFYQQAVTYHPENAELRANLGLMYYQTGKDQQAIDAFSQAIRLKPGLFVPNLFLGLDYVKLRQFKEAIPYLKRAAQSKPADAQTQLGLGQAYAGSGNTRLAIRSYVRANEIEPQNADAWYHLGVAYLEQVEADARVLLTQHKDSGYPQALLAGTFAEQHALIQAAEAYKKALSLDSFPPNTHAGYGFVLVSRHDLPSAKQEFNRELAANPGSLMAKLGLARVHIEHNEVAESAKEIAEVFEADPAFFASNSSLFSAGLTVEKRNELDSVLEQRQAAGETPEKLLALFRNVPAEQRSSESPKITTADENLASNATGFYKAGKYTKCSDALAPRLESLPMKDLRLLATCAYLNGNTRTAFEAARRLAASSQTEAEGLYWETRSSQKLATQALSRASQLDSGSPKMHVLLGDIGRQRQDFAAAEQEYRKALALQPNDTGALFGLALALLADNLPEEASRVTQDALANSPDDPEINAVMGEILCARHDFASAEPYLKRSLNAKPEYVLHVHALLGNVYAHTDRIQEAMAELKLALPGDKDGSLHYQIGRLYLKVGDKKAATDAFEDSQRLKKEGLEHAAIAMQQGEDDEPQ